MNREKLAELILSWYIGEITEEQQDKLDQWLSEDPSHRELFEQITNRERIRNKQTLLTLFDRDKAWERVYRSTRRKLQVRIMRYAAVAVLLIGISITWLFQTTETKTIQQISLKSPENVCAILISNAEAEKSFITEKQYSVQESKAETPAPVDTLTITIPQGGEFHLTLNDGTEVWLNSETQVRFPSRFDSNIREVTLISGEAYFMVAKNIHKPFVVRSQDTEVKVLGTEFNLQNYPNEQNIVTTLVNGSVQLSGMPEALKPGQQSIFNKETQESTIREVDTHLYTAWKEGRFVFKGIQLENILNQMSRWYGVQFEFQDEQLKKLPFSGNVPKYADGNTLLKVLMSTGQIKFIQKGDVIVVTK